MPVIVQNLGVPIGTALGKWVQEATIAAGEQALRDEVGKGFDTEPVVVTDGVTRRDYRQVRPFGKIEFDARSNMADVVLWTLDALRKISPVLTGRYAASHEPFINNQPVTGDIRRALLNVKPTDIVMIVNDQPYAGKIEGRDAYTRWEIGGGKRSRRAQRRAHGWKPRQYGGESSAAKAGVYRVVLFKIINRFGKTVAVDFRPVPLPGGMLVKGSAGGRSRKRILRPQMYPAFIFTSWR